VKDMTHNNTMRGASAVAWIALVGAVLALLLGWTAFNRSGRDVSTIVENQTQEAVEDVAIITARAQAAAELTAIRAQIETQQNLQEAQAQLQNTRADLRQAYANASIEVRQEWQQIDAQLQNAEDSIRNNSANAIENLNDALATLKRDIRTDDR
jgi:uncharacterized protein (DUF342 family)